MVGVALEIFAQHQSDLTFSGIVKIEIFNVFDLRSICRNCSYRTRLPAGWWCVLGLETTYGPNCHFSCSFSVLEERRFRLALGDGQIRGQMGFVLII